MELLPIARRLWRRRLLVFAGAVVCLAMAVMGGLPRSSYSFVATTRVALDTPRSQLVESAPGGADSLPWRTALLMHLMVTDPIQRDLARRLAVRPDQVTVADPALAVPLVPASMPKRAANAAAVTGSPYVLTVTLLDPALPIISLEAAAPSRAGAVRLAEAGASVLESQGSASGNYKSMIPSVGSPARQPFVVQSAGAVHVKAVPAKKLPLKALAAAIFLLVWCVCVALLPAPRLRGPRVAAPLHG